MNVESLNKLIVVHNTLYQMKVSGEQTAPVAQCILTLQDIIGQAQKESIPRDGQETEEVNADKMEEKINE